MKNGSAAYKLPLQQLRLLMLQPIRIGGLTITLLDALSADHDEDWSYPSHRHPWYEFNYVSDGGLFTTIAGDEFRIEAGQSYLIPPGIVHSHRHRQGESDEGFCLRWQIVDEAHDDLGTGTAEEKEFLQCFAQIRPYALKPETAAPLLALRSEMSVLALRSAFASWITGLFEDWRANTQIPLLQSHDHSDVIVRQTLLYLNAYYATELRVQDIASSLHVSYRTLARLFKQRTGVTVIEKLNDIRIKQAKKLLIETQLTLKQIALAVGLKNEFYFSTLFRQVAMVTPSSFRELHKPWSERLFVT
ncbi:AraC family transcriptional regulator [Paenibacillus sp. OV219]|uniref:helix-turn-helix transcriptional regulator n=1 Tax=Paenibacillus sp. OV219 TaxID=1884377 RepID=UPI0008AEF767|nr:helix-turn-helix domain-containing protein [Paenibacillus sp. OV219]SEN96381.1 AraC-like ligand binding domain-containing protein [Paenibacillus sp. OV219]